MTTLDVLNNLEQRLAALERQLGDSPGVSSLQPNVLTVASDGTIGADFTGKIRATELDLTGGANASPIKWQTAAGGLLAELLVNANGDLTLSPSGNLQLPEATTQAIPPPNSLAWIDGGATIRSFIQGRNIAGVGREIDIDCNGAFAMLLNEAGGSDFVRGAGKLKFGVKVATFPGGSPFVDATVTTLMGVAAQVVTATPQEVFDPACICEWLPLSAPDANHEVIRIETRDGTNPVAGTTKGIGWIAVA